MTPPEDFDEQGGPQLRTPPHSLEAEQSVLGGLLLDNASMRIVAEVIEAGDFFRHQHQTIFATLASMIADGIEADVITVYERLEAAGKATECGGLKYLNDLAQSVASAANARRYCEIVKERALLRRLISTSDQLASRAFSNEPSGDLLDSMRVELGNIEQRRGPNARRVPMLNLQQLRESSEAVRWVVKNVIPAESVGMLFGASGTFKSFVAIDAALHVAHGLPWMGRKTNAGPVLYIAAEGGSGLWKRVAAWHRHRRLQWGDVPFYVVPVALDLACDAWRVVEAAQALGVHPSMVVVDTLSQTYSGEENSANEMAAYLRELGTRFRSLWQCAVLLIHHTGHLATERPRGSSAIRANVDFMFGVFRDEKEMLSTLTCSKQKEADAFPDASFQLLAHELGKDEDGDPVTSLVARHLSSAEEVREVMATESKAGRGGNNQLLLRLAYNGMQESDLRTAFYADSGLDSADARRQAYHRAKAWACKSGLLEVAEGVVITLKSGD